MIQKECKEKVDTGKEEDLSREVREGGEGG